MDLRRISDEPGAGQCGVLPPRRRSREFGALGVVLGEVFGGDGLTHQHPVGTCRMGPAGDPVAVAPTGAVHCVEDLYVIDASVMPGLPTANPNLRAGTGTWPWPSRRLCCTVHDEPVSR
ncbi:GMC oxidoreductase [Streptomyces flaveolus]|uniref:GMC oxidoreductase n=1 Tax=Streptomyces flaveolus TaxID=67297 RepID=UPI003418B51E